MMILFAASCSPYMVAMCCIGIEVIPPRTSRRLVQVAQAHSTWRAKVGWIGDICDILVMLFVRVVVVVAWVV